MSYNTRSYGISDSCEFATLQEARALLGRLEYQRGNIEAALRVFDGIDFSALAPKIKMSITRRKGRRKVRSRDDGQPMSLHAVSLLIEAIFLKAKALRDLGRFKGKKLKQQVFFLGLFCVTELVILSNSLSCVYVW